MQIITGMHRSGTSLVARLFFEAGADMGDANAFYRPDRWNPDGYYEQPDIHAINMPLINGPWWKFAYYRLPSTATILKRSEKMSDLIRRTAEKYQQKVIKETRYCLTLPAWQKYNAQIDKILICLREPIQVARSIQKRNYTTINHGFSLWYIHNSRILEHSKDIPIWIVDYQNLLNASTSKQEIDLALRFFGIYLGSDRLEEICKKAIKPSMNHNPELEKQYPRHIADLLETLRTIQKSQKSDINR